MIAGRTRVVPNALGECRGKPRINHNSLRVLKQIVIKSNISLVSRRDWEEATTQNVHFLRIPSFKYNMYISIISIFLTKTNR